MRAAREVIADGLDHEALIAAFAQYVRKHDDWLQAVVELHDDVNEAKEGAEKERAVLTRTLTDAAIAALRAEGLVIVAAADVRWLIAFVARDFQRDGYPVCGEAVDVTNRLDAALAAGGTDGH